jgi:hypothetical protein
MEKEMCFAHKLAGAALVTLLLIPGSTIALERHIQVVGPIDAPVIDVTPERLSPGDMGGFGDSSGDAGPPWDGTFDRGNDQLPYFPIDINGTQVERPGTIFPDPKVRTPTLIFGETGKGALGGKTRTLELAVACKVAGTPRKAPDDLILINQGPTLSAGTTIRWKVKSAGQGAVQLTRDLPTGATVKANGVLETGVPTDNPCTAKII